MEAAVRCRLQDRVIWTERMAIGSPRGYVGADQVFLTRARLWRQGRIGWTWQYLRSVCPRDGRVLSAWLRLQR